MKPVSLAIVSIVLILSLLVLPTQAAVIRGDTLNITTPTLVVPVPPGITEISPFLTSPDPRTHDELIDPHNPNLEGLKNREQTGSFIAMPSTENISAHYLVDNNHIERSTGDDNRGHMEGSSHVPYFGTLYVRQTFRINTGMGYGGGPGGYIPCVGYQIDLQEWEGVSWVTTASQVTDQEGNVYFNNLTKEKPGTYFYRHIYYFDDVTDISQPYDIDFIERPPVILVHGWRGSPETWTNLIVYLDHENIPYATFDYAPGLGDPYQYAVALDTFIDKYKADKKYTGKVDIVCHSMGAMVSRIYMEELGGSKNVRQWIGVCPVNHGAAIADWQPSWYASWFNKFLGIHFKGSEPAVTAMKTTSPTVRNLTQSYAMRDRNVIYRVIVGYNGDNSNSYSSFFSGKTRAKDVSTGKYYWTNLGDGIVAVEQSKLSGAGIDYFSGKTHNSALDSQAVNLRIIEYLKDPSKASSNNIPSNEQEYLEVAEVGYANQGNLPQGQSSTLYRLVDKTTGKIWFHLGWPGSDLNLTLISPSGNPYQQLSYYKDNTSIWYEIDNPEEGNWTAQIDPVDIPVTGEPYTLTCLVSSDLTFTAGTNQPDNVFHQNEYAVIQAELKNGTSYINGATVQMNTTDPDGSLFTSYLHDDGTNGDSISGDGIYSLSFMLDKLGIYQYGITATNQSANLERETSLTVYSIPPQPTISYIIPEIGYIGTTMTINDLHGSNFQPNSTVKLSKSGQSDIFADYVIVASSSQINCNFNIPSEASLGTWDVTITTLEYQSATLSGGFKINATLPDTNFTGSPLSGTVPLLVIFTDNSINTPTSWNWSFGDGSYSTDQNPWHSYSVASNYTVSLTATNSVGTDVFTRTNYITVSSSVVAPVAAFSGSPTSGTAPLTVTFTDSSTNTPTSWSWNFGDSSSVNATVKNPVHTYASAGMYTVALTATNSAGSNTATKTSYITVNSGSAGYTVGAKNINSPMATVCIGEQDLDFTGALQTVNGGGNITRTTIGWWASAAQITTSSPTISIDLAGQYTDYQINPATFVGYTGNWWLLQGPTDPNPGQSFDPPRIFMNVLDPSLDIKIWDYDNSTGVNGGSVPQGEHLGFQIYTNMYWALDARYRAPVYNRTGVNADNVGDGYMMIRVQDPSGTTLTNLYSSDSLLKTLTYLNVSTQPYTWGTEFGNYYNWDTGSKVSASTQYVYTPGTYTVYAESYLNNMKNNYKNGGSYYTGKTISETKTVTVIAVSGIDTVGVFRGGVFYRNGADAIVYGISTDTPVIGDWNGDGISKVGVFRGGVFYRDGYDAIVYGLPTDTPVIGKWT